MKNNQNTRIGKTMLLLAVIIVLAAAGATKVQAAAQPVSVTSCKLNAGGKKITVKAKVKTKTKAMGKKLYLLGLNANVSESGKKSAKPLASAKAKKGKITFKVNYSSSMLYQKFVVAYKKNKKYVITSDAMYITNPEALATYTGTGPKAASKKGLQVEELSDSLEIGTQHAVINWTLNSIMNNNAAHKTEFTYKGKRYYFDADLLQKNDEQVKAYNAAGVRVTVILLLPKDASSGGTASMQFGGNSYTKFSSIKTSSAAGCRAFEAVMAFLAARYGTKENLVCGWILGNEVNSAAIWNYGGGKSLDNYMANYARAFRICYNAVKSVNKHAKVYISLDNNWNRDIDGKGKQYFSSKETVDKFYEKLKAQGKIGFQIAFHAYPQGMSDPIFWDDTQATSSKKSPIINFKNIKVLTSYAKSNFGKDCTVMLSEQSFNSSRGQEIQAAAYAYAYYISEGNSQIEAFIYGREFDHPEEMKSGYHWGLCDNWHSKRLIWSVFQYIDSKESFTFTDPLLKYTNLKKWNKIDGFKKSYYTKKASKLNKAAITSVEPASATELALAWEKLNTGDGYEIYRNGSKIATITGNSNITYKDKNLQTGVSYQYQIRMYKDAPGKRLYGTFSDAALAAPTAGQVILKPDDCEVSGNEIKIAWKKMDDAAGFEVFRSTEENGTYTLLATVTGDKNSYKDKDTVSGMTYYYKVRAFSSAGGLVYYGKYSETLAKQAMIQLTAGIADGKVVLNWTKWLDADRYRVYCKPKAASDYVRMKSLNALTYSSRQYNDVPNHAVEFTVGEVYCFRVRADFGNGTYSKYSNVVELLIDGQFNLVPVPTGADENDEMISTETESTQTESTEAEETERTETEDTEAAETESTETERTETEGTETAETERTETEDTETDGTERTETEDTETAETERTETEDTETAETEHAETESKEAAETERAKTESGKPEQRDKKSRIISAWVR